MEFVAAANEALVAVPAADSQIEIELAGGRQVRFSGSHDPDLRARLIRGLAA